MVEPGIDLLISKQRRYQQAKRPEVIAFTNINKTAWLFRLQYTSFHTEKLAIYKKCD